MVFPLAASAQDDNVDEEVVVVGNKSISTLRKEVYEAEADFYALYNTLNDDPDYDVKCYYETATGTHVKNHVCRANFIAASYAKHAARNGNDLSRVAAQTDPARTSERHTTRTPPRGNARRRSRRIGMSLLLLKGVRVPVSELR